MVAIKKNIFWVTTLIVAFIALVNFQFDKKEEVKITYVFDPLCGWCYGFSPVIDSLQKVYHNQIDFEVIPGGMVRGSRIGPVSNISDFLLKAYPGVEKTTSVKFGEPFINNLKEGSVIFNSEPPSMAMTLFKHKQADHQIQFAKAIQKAIYYNGFAPQDTNGYGGIAKQFGLDSAAFVIDLKNDSLKIETLKEFKNSTDIGATGFPTVILQKGGQSEILTRGYSSFQKMDNKITQFLKK